MQAAKSSSGSSSIKAQGSRSSLCTPPLSSTTSTSCQDVLRKQNDAVDKVLLLKEQATQRQEELRAGQAWNEVLKDPLNRRDPQQLAGLWDEVKARLVRRFGTLPAALATFEHSGDGSITFAKFWDLLQSVNLPLNMATCRSIYSKATAGERSLSLESLKSLLLGRTIRKLRFIMERFNDKQARVLAHRNHFLRRLMESNLQSFTRCIDQFQRKLLVALVKKLWQCVVRRLGRPSDQDAMVDRATFAHAVNDLVGGTDIQAYEQPFMLAVFDQLDHQRREAVELTSLISGLLLLSPEPERREKVALLFEAYDTDYDGCLRYDQIHEMCRVLCFQRPRVEESARSAEDPAFQDELSQQEGVRCYECIRWNLQRTGNVNIGIVSFPELWGSLDGQPELLQCLFPGMIPMRWLLNMPLAEVATPELRPPALPPPSTATHHLQEAGLRDVRHGPPGTAGARRVVPHGPGTGHSTAADGAKVEGHAERSDGAGFKHTVTQRFRLALRGLGDQRLAELAVSLQRGVNQAEEADIMSDRQASISVADWNDLVGTLSASLSRDRCGSRGWASSPSRRSSRPVSAVSSAAPESPTSQATRTPTSGGGSMMRVNTAPAGLVAPQQPGLGTASTPGLPPTPSSPRSPASGPARGAVDGGVALSATHGMLDTLELPQIPTQKWGIEAADRFRLRSTVKPPRIRSRREPVDPHSAIGYRCQLCLHMHALCAAHA